MLRRSAHTFPLFCALLLLGLLTITTTQARGAPPVSGSPDIENMAETVTTSPTNGITFVSGAKASAIVKTPSIAVPTPVQAGDRLLLTASLADVTSAVGPAGWTLVADKSAASLRSVVWSRIATAGDAGKSVAIVLNAARKAALTVTAYRGVDPTGAVSATASADANSTSHTTPSLVVPSGAWVVSYWADKGTSTTRWTTPATTSLRADAYSTGSGRVSAAVADSNAARSGTVGGVTATTNAMSARAVNWSIVLPAKNLPPQAEFTQSCVDLTCVFDASATTDADGTVDDYAWDLGAGGTATGKTVSYDFAEPGTYAVRLAATDNDGDSAQRLSSVNVTAPVSKTLLGFWAGADVVGSGEGARANYDRVSSYLGQPDVYRMFFPGSPGTNFVGSNADFGPPVVVSFKFRPQEIVTGQHDATLRAWFASIPVDSPGVVVLLPRAGERYRGWRVHCRGIPGRVGSHPHPRTEAVNARPDFAADALHLEHPHQADCRVVRL